MERIIRGSGPGAAARACPSPAASDRADCRACGRSANSHVMEVAHVPWRAERDLVVDQQHQCGEQRTQGKDRQAARAAIRLRRISIRRVEAQDRRYRRRPAARSPTPTPPGSPPTARRTSAKRGVSFRISRNEAQQGEGRGLVAVGQRRVDVRRRATGHRPGPPAWPRPACSPARGPGAPATPPSRR